MYKHGPTVCCGWSVLSGIHGAVVGGQTLKCTISDLTPAQSRLAVDRVASFVVSSLTSCY